MGSPETLACFFSAWDGGHEPVARVMLYLDGMGFLLHHAAASFIMTGLSLGGSRRRRGAVCYAGSLPWGC